MRWEWVVERFFAEWNQHTDFENNILASACVLKSKRCWKIVRKMSGQLCNVTVHHLKTLHCTVFSMPSQKNHVFGIFEYISVSAEKKRRENVAKHASRTRRTRRYRTPQRPAPWLGAGAMAWPWPLQAICTTRNEGRGQYPLEPIAHKTTATHNTRGNGVGVVARSLNYLQLWTWSVLFCELSAPNDSLRSAELQKNVDGAKPSQWLSRRRYTPLPLVRLLITW